MRPIFAILLAFGTIAWGDVKMELKSVYDTRDTQRFTSKVDAQLDVSGSEVAQCKGVRITVSSAADETGGSLLLPADRLRAFAANSSQFHLLNTDETDRQNKKAGKASLSIQLANPPRTATQVKLDASLELLFPENDPASVLTFSLAENLGKPLNDARLKETGVAIALKELEHVSLFYLVADPNRKLACVELCNAAGVPLPVTRTVVISDEVETITLTAPPPTGAIVKVYLATEKAVRRIPIPFRSLPLP